jgi:RNA polymerase sigma-70 factor (ECF subfamily)
MCGNASLAEDAAQEAFVRSWQHLPNYKPRSPFRNWLYRIAINSARDMLRRERETVDIDDLPLASPDEGPAGQFQQAEQARIVQQAVLSLPPGSREVVVLREYEGLTYREIADTLGIPVGTVMSRLNYARTSLRQTLSVFLEAL